MKYVIIALITFQKIEDAVFSAGADLIVATTNEKTTEMENRFLEIAKQNMIEKYPGWTNFKGNVYFLSDSTIQEVIEGWKNAG